MQDLASVADVEPSEFPARLGLGDVDAADEALHLALQCVGQRVQIFVVTLGDHLDASVREVADVAGHRMVAGQVLGRAWFDDPLSSGDYESTFLWDASHGMTFVAAERPSALNDAGQFVRCAG